MKDIIGYDEGLIYELLVSNSYGLQLEEKRTLSETQIKNIESYFTDKVYVDFLLAENKKVEASKLNAIELNINETPKTSKEKLMDAIVAKHRGSVVVVYFWATWCGPCLQSMGHMRPMKEELTDKNIVYIYITNSSSRKGLWHTKIKDIGGEHYYLEEDTTWEYIFEKYQLEVIPSYLIFGKNGKLAQKSEGFPGVEVMTKWIEELL